MAAAAAGGILFTIGEDETATPTLKIWSVDKDVVEKNKGPVLVQHKKITHKAKVFPNMTQVAVGLENGIVILYRGDLSRPRHSKTVVVHEGSETDGMETTLYIVTLARILGCVTTGKDVKQNILEEQGTEIGLSLATPYERDQEMAMARNEAVYFYGPDGRGPCFIIDGEKSHMTWFRGYLVLVSKEMPLRANVLTEFGNASESAFSPDADSALSRSWPSGGPTPGHVLTIYDLKSKFIAYRGSFGTRRFDASPIKHVLAEWGELFVVTKENKMFRLREFDLDSKLELLHSKNLYNLAVSIMVHPASAMYSVAARNDYLLAAGAAGAAAATDASGLPKVDESTRLVIMDIYRRHGDYLYGRGDFDASMKQYIKTIGNLEPSYVIRKFLDAQRIYNLTSYLQALHDQGLANPNHTTLLLNCYTKLKDTSRLDAFVDNTEAVFDFDTAIRVCRLSGYYQQALRLASRFEQHEWYLRVQIEDLQGYDDAVTYLARLPRQQVYKALTHYGHVLVKHRPKPATEMLVRACTFSKQEIAALSARNSVSADSWPPVEQPSAQGASSLSASALAIAASKDPEAELARPQDFLCFFVNQPSWCVAFIENVLRKRWGLTKDSGSDQTPTTLPVSPSKDPHKIEADTQMRQALWDALLELYLVQIDQSASASGSASGGNSGGASSPRSSIGDPSEKMTGPKHNWAKKIMTLLQNPKANYDLDQALVLCKTHRFEEGVLYLYKQLRLYHDYLEYHMEREEYSLVLQTCQMFGDNDPSLWTKALIFFVEKGVRESSATSPGADGTGTSAQQQETRDNLVKVLDQIEKRKLLSQLQVVQLLSKNSAVTLGMVRDYLIKRIETDVASIDESRQLIASYQEETAKMRQQIQELEQGSLTFQATRCELCRQPLELPTVHFYCKHAYHHRCLGDADKECPRCAPEHRLIQELVKSQRVNAQRHDLFVKKLVEGSEHEDKFGIIADYFSKNVFAA
ncbi:hypothetical protein BC831DRAFT_441260 [Entophlyctis helioformis]|nr:hypothetical protein BC831DRAFT_441260 [Entophlyctis helioformis]